MFGFIPIAEFLMTIFREPIAPPVFSLYIVVRGRWIKSGFAQVITGFESCREIELSSLDDISARSRAAVMALTAD